MAQSSGIKIAAWAKAEQRKKDREENRGSVRAIFGFLFCAAILVYVFSDHSNLQKLIQSKIYPVINQVMVQSHSPSYFRQGAIKHENEVNEINQ
jgi:membrane-anchored protein YejM (alkaline phosphatase superfamily)